MIPSDDYFKNLAYARPFMEKYNSRFVEKFTAFLDNQTYDMLIRVLEVKRDNVARSAGNSYSHINILYKICDIVINEIVAGYVPMTCGVTTYEDAIDKYRKLVFLRRRVELFRADWNSDQEDLYIEEARDYILSEKISPIALSYIIKHEIGGDAQKAVNYWQKIYRSANMEREAMLLIAL